MIGLLACSTTNPPAPSVSYTLERTPDGALAQTETEIIEVRALVTKVNLKTRQLTLKDSDGKLFSVVAGPEVKRLNEIKVGDTVALKHQQTMAFEVRKPTKAELANPEGTFVAAGRADQAHAPAIGATVIDYVIVKIKAIDLKNGTVSVQLPEGKTVLVKARHPENLRRVKVGDTVLVTFAESIALEVEPAKS